MPAETSTMRERFADFLQRKFGNTALHRQLLSFSEYIYFSIKVFRSLSLLKGSHVDTFISVVINQVKFTGAHALPLLSVISLSIGATTIIQAVTFLPRLGQEGFIGNLLKLVIVREIGPLITAIIVLTRSGSAIASELATQKLHNEIEAIQRMGINPYFHIVLPRVVGGVIAVTLLIVYFDFIAILGGYLISLLIGKGFPFTSFMETILRSLTFSDLLSTLGKSITYGIVIPLTTAYFGLKPTTLFQIPIFVSKAVVHSLLSVFILNAVISVILYL